MYSEELMASGAVLWRSRGGGPAAISADGCVDLILRGEEILVAGPSTRWISTLPDADDDTVGIRLAPGAATTTLPLDLAELRDQLVSLRDVSGGETVSTLRDVLLRARSSPRALGLLERADLPLGPAPGWTAQVRRRAQRGTSARSAAAELSWSEREFRRQMLARFGYGYGALVRIERVQRAQALIQGGATLSDAAVASGYADQPHLTREFRRLVGATPAQFAASAAKRSTELPSGSSRVA
ncbi:helix-turn-helix transcriptional regulator [Oerskovia flava]|uniref:helix-turn-helix transcriptional regulator n=1 Tax=Oerskovia flava TaxID=2986422 RepID=UPI00223FB202|nr:helix-turn-helix transcriptional regulator [Oerskovia sp. JB1-3-2]